MTIMLQSNTVRYRIILILLLLLAFFIRLETLDLKPLWFDEVMEYWVATAPLDQIGATVKDLLQDPPLYSLALNIWMNFGRDEFTLRLLSTFVSVLTVATAFAFGKHAHSRKTGIIAALLFAILPPQIRMAQEVGQYAFLVFFLLMNLLMMSYARQTNQGKYWIAWTMTALASAYNYYGSLLIIGPVAVVVFLENAYRRRTKYLKSQAIASFAFGALALLVLVSWFPDQLLRGPTSNALQVRVDSLYAEASILLTRTKYLLAYQFLGYIADPAEWMTLQRVAWLLVLFSLLFSIYGLKKSTKYAYVIVWLLASWTAYYASGRFGAYPYGGTRHALILAPLLILVVAIGLATMWDTWRSIGLITLVSIVVITLASPGENPEDLRTVVTQYLAKREENTPTYVYYTAVPAFRYQLASRGEVEEDVPASWYRDCWGGELEAYCENDDIVYGRWIRRLSADEKVKEILSVLGSDAEAEFWLIFSHTSSADRGAIFDELGERFDTIEAVEATGASAFLLRKR